MTIDEALRLPEYAKVTYAGKPFDFGYVSQTGRLVLYEEGERNMQDSFAVPPDLVTAPPYCDEPGHAYACECFNGT